MIKLYIYNKKTNAYESLFDEAEISRTNKRPVNVQDRREAKLQELQPQKDKKWLPLFEKAGKKFFNGVIPSVGKIKHGEWLSPMKSGQRLIFPTIFNQSGIKTKEMAELFFEKTTSILKKLGIEPVQKIIKKNYILIYYEYKI